jgi:hypothetical protein
MSNGRAASAVMSQRAKQELVRILFADASTKTSSSRTTSLASRPAHRKPLLDANQYTYQELRTLYLRKVHELHPDKALNGKKGKALFVELQDAWISYEQHSKLYRQSAGRNEVEGDFTMFGVGCSFSDNEEETRLRVEIMDQAGRGWFTSGLLFEKPDDNTSMDFPENPSNQTPLFTQMDGDNVDDTVESIYNHDEPPSGDKAKRSLIADQIPPWKRPSF